MVEQRLTRYNKPARRQALLEIRKLIVEEGLSHQEIQLRLNLPNTTYFRYLDLLFEQEQQAIAGDNYTYQRLLNETLILQQRYLRRARRLEKLADDPTIDPEIRLEAEIQCAHLERAVHDIMYQAPSYLAVQKLLPGPKDRTYASLSMTEIHPHSEERDPSEFSRLSVAGVMRKANQAALEANSKLEKKS